MKTIVTHFAPDTDAVTSVWLLKRFLPGWADADILFVPAGKTLNNELVDTDPDILHVDTGMGMLDHHQTDEDTCAARRCMEYIASQTQKLKLSPSPRLRGTSKTQNQNGKDCNNFFDDALERLVDVVNDIDHFREVYYPNPTADFYDFGVVAMLDGLKLLYSNDHMKLIDISLDALDGIYRQFQNKVWAEKEIVEKGVEFQTKFGKGLAIETINDEVVRIAQRQGRVIAVRKDPKKGYARIKALPESAIDLTTCYNRFRKLDDKATWFLHASHKMVLNGSVKNPESKPTVLTLRELVDVLKDELGK